MESFIVLSNDNLIEYEGGIDVVKVAAGAVVAAGGGVLVADGIKCASNTVTAPATPLLIFGGVGVAAAGAYLMYVGFTS